MKHVAVVCTLALVLTGCALKPPVYVCLPGVIQGGPGVIVCAPHPEDAR